MRTPPRLLSFFMALVILFCLLPLPASAKENETPPESREENIECAAIISENMENETAFNSDFSIGPTINATEEPEQADEIFNVELETDSIIDASRNEEYKFISQPVSTFKASNNSFTVSWTTSFIPTKVELGYFSADSFFTKKRITSDLDTEMSFDLPINLATMQNMAVRAYYGSPGSAYIDSEEFAINWDDVKFTAQPANTFNFSNSSFSCCLLSSSCCNRSRISVCS